MAFSQIGSNTFLTKISICELIDHFARQLNIKNWIVDTINMNKNTSKIEQKPQQLPGLQTYKIYSKIFGELLAQHNNIVQKIIPHLQSTKYNPTILIDVLNQYIYPTLVKHIRLIVNPQTILWKQTHEKIIGELVELAQSDLNNHQKRLTVEEQQFYEKIANQNQITCKDSKRFKKFKLFEWTASKMHKLDILSLFLRLNHKYKKIYNINFTVISPKLICTIFKINLTQFDEYQSRLEQYEAILTHNYQEDFQEIIIIFCFIEIKIKISNFRKRYGAVKAAKFQLFNSNLSTKEEEKGEYLNQQAYFYTRNEYKYNFCEIAFIPKGQNINKQISMLKPSRQKQCKEILQNINKIQKKYKQKQEILKAKIRFNVSFLSLFKYLQDVQQRFHQKEVISHQKEKDLQNCRWIYLKTKQLATGLKDILKQEVSGWKLHRNNNPLIICLCLLAIRRFKLLSTVIKAQERIDRVLQRKTIHICRFQYSLDNYCQNQSQNEEKNVTFTLIIGTSDSQLKFAAFFQKRLTDYEFGETVKQIINPIRQKKLNIAIYNFDYTREYDWQSLRKLMVIKQASDTRVEIYNSGQYFLIHYFAHHLIHSFTKEVKINKKNFGKIVEQSTNKVLIVLHLSSKSRQLLFSIVKPQQSINNYSQFCNNFDIQKLQTKVEQAYHMLNHQQLSINNSDTLWTYGQQIFEGKIIYFKQDCLYALKANKNSAFSKDIKFDVKSFVSQLIEEMKWRHPQLTKQEELTIYEDSHYFMGKYHIGIEHIKRILKGVARFLLYYQEIYNQLICFNQISIKKAQFLRQQLQFLRNIYEEENRHIDKFYPGEKGDMLMRYFATKLEPELRLKINHQKLRILLNEQPDIKNDEDAAKKEEQVPKRQEMEEETKKVEFNSFPKEQCS